MHRSTGGDTYGLHVLVGDDIVPEILEGHAEAVGEAVHVSEIPGNLVDVEDGAVAKAGCAQCEHIEFGHVPRRQRQLFGVAQHGVLSSRNVGPAPVMGELAHQRRILGETTETPSMMGHSVDAMIGARHHHRNHLALGSAELGFATHHGDIQQRMGLERIHVETVNLHDVVNPAPRLHGFGVLACQLAFGFVLGNHTDPGHVRYSLSFRGNKAGIAPLSHALARLWYAQHEEVASWR